MDPWRRNAMSARQRAAFGSGNAYTLPEGSDPNALLGRYHGPAGGNNQECLANWQELTGAPHSQRPGLFGGASLSSINRNHPALRRGLVVGYGFDGPGGRYASRAHYPNHAAYVVSDGRNLRFYHVFAGTAMTNNLPPQYRSLNDPTRYQVMISR